MIFWLTNGVLILFTMKSAWMVLGFVEVWVSHEVRSNILENLRIMYPFYIPAITVLLIVVSAFYLMLTKRSSSLFALFFAVEVPLILIEFATLALPGILGMLLPLLSSFILMCSLIQWYLILWGKNIASFDRRARAAYTLLNRVSMILCGAMIFVGLLWMESRSGTRVMRFLIIGMYPRASSGLPMPEQAPGNETIDFADSFPLSGQLVRRSSRRSEVGFKENMRIFRYLVW